MTKSIKFRKPNLTAMREEIVRKSEIELFVLPDGGLEIIISGPAAHIPTLKNAPMTTKGATVIFTDPIVITKLQALTKLYSDALVRQGRSHPIMYGKQRLWVNCILSRDCYKADEDNCYATIKDWLEPQTKGGRERKDWGIAMVENDRYIKGFAVHGRDVSFDADTTHIIVQLWEARRKAVIQHIAEQRAGINLEGAQCPLDL